MPSPGPAYPPLRREVYLNIAVVIEQYIFQLQVPVDHTILKWEDREGTEWERMGWERGGGGGRRQSPGKYLTDKRNAPARWSLPPSFRAALPVVKLLPGTRDRRALVTCCVVKGKMTGIHSPPEPVKQQGDPLSECHSIVWKQYSPRRRHTVSVCDVIPRDDADFAAGDSECRAHRPCLFVCPSVCLPACLLSAGKKPGSIYSDPWNQSRSFWR